MQALAPRPICVYFELCGVGDSLNMSFRLFGAEHLLKIIPMCRQYEHMEMHCYFS